MNWGSLKSQVLSRIHDTSLAALVPDWYNEVQLELLSETQWRHLDDSKILPTTAPYSTGTASATNGSATITFAGGASVASGAAGQLISVGGKYYKILTRDSSTQVTLESNYIGTTGSGLVYTIVFAFLTMPSNFSPPRLYTATLQASAGDVFELEYMSDHDLFEYDADEVSLNGRPYSFRFFEGVMALYPPPDAAYNVQVFYNRIPNTVSTTSADSVALDWPDYCQYALLQGTFAIGYEQIDDTLAEKARSRFDQALASAKDTNNRKPGVGAGRLKKWCGSARGGRLPYRIEEPIG